MVTNGSPYEEGSKGYKISALSSDTSLRNRHLRKIYPLLNSKELILACLTTPLGNIVSEWCWHYGPPAEMLVQTIF